MRTTALSPELRVEGSAGKEVSILLLTPGTKNKQTKSNSQFFRSHCLLQMSSRCVQCDKLKVQCVGAFAF